MKKTILSALALLGGFAISSAQSQYVAPFIGTDGMGHTFPGACRPFGLVQLSPDTDTIPHNVAGRYVPEVYGYCAGYRYGDPTITGFSHTHLSGTGHSDLGDVLIMPATGPALLNPGTADAPQKGYRSRFSHDSETARPGYYAVTLDDYGIRAELTATARTGVHRYTFPSGEGHIVLDLSHGLYNYEGKTLWAGLRVENDTLLTGWRLTNGWARENFTYFAISLSKPIVSYGYKESAPQAYNGFWRKFRIHEDFPEMAGRGIAAWFSFDFSDGKPLEIKTALSSTGTDGALLNLIAETQGKDFDTIAAEAAAQWDRELGQIEIAGTEDQKVMFYTSLYHTMINPSVYSDVDGRYRGLDGNVHQAEDFTDYTVFSLWDTWRAEHPLLMLLKPDRATDMAKSMLAHQDQSVHGLLPIWSLMGNEGWCMSGYHAVSVLSDALAKGAPLDRQAVLKAMKATAHVPYLDGLDDYMSLGYIPFERSSTAASTTLEYAYDDWAIYAAGGGGEFRARASNWRNVTDPATGFARPRLRDGSFKTPFDPAQTWGEGFIEGNSWNFSFHVPHDVSGLITAMGGEKRFIARLDSLFGMNLDPVYYADNEDITEDCLIGGYVHGNEPSHHVPYLYAWTSQPWKTHYWLREIMNSMYRNDIRGLGGNDDCGQMSAWYIFSAMGFYPVCPGTDQYVLGAPYIPYAKIDLPGGGTFEVRADGVSDVNRYVKSVRLNGKPYTKLYITHKDITEGGILEFEMSSRPGRRRVSIEDKPYSLSLE